MFYSAPEHEWILSDALRHDGREYLWGKQTFEQITEQIVSEAVIIKTRNEFLKFDNGLCRDYKRTKVILLLNKATVDLFHNSKNGYRAQYYYSIENGEAANSYLLEKLSCLIFRQKSNDCLMPSLMHPDAKIWIHEGIWLRPPGGMKIHRNLNVARWCKETEKWAHWSKLTPLEEKIEIKGAYLNKDGNEVPKELVSEFRMKASAIRSKRLYKYGYT